METVSCQMKNIVIQIYIIGQCYDGTLVSVTQSLVSCDGTFRLRTFRQDVKSEHLVECI